MNDNSFDLLFKKAKKIRTNLLLYTEKCIKDNKKKEKSNEIYNLNNQTIFQEGSIEVSFQEFYVEKNVQIFTQQLENKENKLVSNISSMSFFHTSEKSLCIFPSLSTADKSTTKKKNDIKKKGDNNIKFLKQKSKTETEKLFLFNIGKNRFPIYYENVNKNINTFNGNLSYDYKKHNTIGKKYLKQLSKFLGVIIHKKKRIDKKSLTKRHFKKFKTRKYD